MPAVAPKPCVAQIFNATAAEPTSSRTFCDWVLATYDTNACARNPDAHAHDDDLHAHDAHANCCEFLAAYWTHNCETTPHDASDKKVIFVIAAVVVAFVARACTRRFYCVACCGRPAALVNEVGAVVLVGVAFGLVGSAAGLSDLAKLEFDESLLLLALLPPIILEARGAAELLSECRDITPTTGQLCRVCGRAPHACDVVYAV